VRIALIRCCTVLGWRSTRPALARGAVVVSRQVSLPLKPGCGFGRRSGVGAATAIVWAQPSSSLIRRRRALIMVVLITLVLVVGRRPQGTTAACAVSARGRVSSWGLPVRRTSVTVPVGTSVVLILVSVSSSAVFFIVPATLLLFRVLVSGGTVSDKLSMIFTVAARFPTSIG